MGLLVAQTGGRVTCTMWVLSWYFGLGMATFSLTTLIFWSFPMIPVWACIVCPDNITYNIFVEGRV